LPRRRRPDRLLLSSRPGARSAELKTAATPVAPGFTGGVPCRGPIHVRAMHHRRLDAIRPRVEAWHLEFDGDPALGTGFGYGANRLFSRRRTSAVQRRRGLHDLDEPPGRHRPLEGQRAAVPEADHDVGLPAAEQAFAANRIAGCPKPRGNSGPPPEIARADDVVAVEDGSRIMPAIDHREPIRDPGAPGSVGNSVGKWVGNVGNFGERRGRGRAHASPRLERRFSCFRPSARPLPRLLKRQELYLAELTPHVRIIA